MPVSTAAKGRKPSVRLIAICALGILFNLWVTAVNKSKRGVDFAQFYAAGEVVGSGQLFDLSVIEAHERPYTSAVGPFVRLPVVALVFKPFTYLSFPAALGLWRCLEVLAGIFGVWLWPDVKRGTLFASLCWSLPAAIVLYYGQDVLFWFFFFGLSLRMMKNEHQYLAGVSFALCICKFHLMLGLAVMLLARRSWRTIAVGAVSGLILLAGSFGLEDSRWPLRFASIASLPVFTPAPQKMPNLYGIVYRLPSAFALEVVIFLAFAVGLWLACRRVPLGIAGGLASASGVLFAHHAYGYDLVLFLPLCAVLIEEECFFPIPLRLCALLALSPLLLFLLASDYSIAAQTAVISLVAWTLWVYRVDFVHTTAISSE